MTLSTILASILSLSSSTSTLLSTASFRMISLSFVVVVVSFASFSLLSASEVSKNCSQFVRRSLVSFSDSTILFKINYIK